MNGLPGRRRSASCPRRRAAGSRTAPHALAAGDHTTGRGPFTFGFGPVVGEQRRALARRLALRPARRCSRRRLRRVGVVEPLGEVREQVDLLGRHRHVDGDAVRRAVGEAAPRPRRRSPSRPATTSATATTRATRTPLHRHVRAKRLWSATEHAGVGQAARRREARAWRARRGARGSPSTRQPVRGERRAARHRRRGRGGRRRRLPAAHRGEHDVGGGHRLRVEEGQLPSGGRARRRRARARPRPRWCRRRRRSRRELLQHLARTATVGVDTSDGALEPREPVEVLVVVLEVGARVVGRAEELARGLAEHEQPGSRSSSGRRAPGFTVPHAACPPSSVPRPAGDARRCTSTSTVPPHAGVASSTGLRSARTTSTSGERAIGSGAVAEHRREPLTRRCTSTISGHGDGRQPPVEAEVARARRRGGRRALRRSCPPARRRPRRRRRRRGRVHAASSSVAHSSRAPSPSASPPPSSSMRPRIARARRRPAAPRRPLRPAVARREATCGCLVRGCRRRRA